MGGAQAPGRSQSGFNLTVIMGPLLEPAQSSGLLNLPEPQFPQLEVRDDNAQLGAIMRMIK